jgi:hypothetical protein
MKTVQSLLKLIRDKAGATAIEYALIGGIICIAVFESGMNDIIVKPYDVSKFIQTLSKNLSEGPKAQDKIIKLKAI